MARSVPPSPPLGGVHPSLAPPCHVGRRRGERAPLDGTPLLVLLQDARLIPCGEAAVARALIVGQLVQRLERV
eukprot:1214375-Prymnesium_polylepis.1